MKSNTSIKSVLINEKAFSLYQSKKITIQEALMLSIIASLDNENGCFATNKYFADNLPIEVDRVKEIIRSLVKKGHVKSEMVNNNTKRILRVVGEEKVKEQALAKVEEIPAQEPVKTKEEKKVVPFNGHKNNTYNKKPQGKFFAGVPSGFNYKIVEQLELLKMALGTGQIRQCEYDELAEPLLKRIQSGT